MASAIRRTEISSAFEAAKAAGFDEVTVSIKRADGSQYLVTAGRRGRLPDSELTPLEKWRAEHVKE